MDGLEEPPRCLACDMVTTLKPLYAFGSPRFKAIEELEPSPVFYANAILVAKFKSGTEPPKITPTGQVQMFRMSKPVYDRVYTQFRRGVQQGINLADVEEGRCITMQSKPKAGTTWYNYGETSVDMAPSATAEYCSDWGASLYDLVKENTRIRLTNEWTAACLKKTLGEFADEMMAKYKELKGAG